jgi:hypothetical protein
MCSIGQMRSYPGHLITVVLSGVVKIFLDYYFNEFAGKIFGYLCASHEKAFTVMDQMRTVVRQCYDWGIPYGVSINENKILMQRETMLLYDWDNS